MRFFSSFLNFVLFACVLFVLGCESILCGAEVKPEAKQSGDLIIEVYQLEQLAPPSGAELVRVQFTGIHKSGGSDRGDTDFDTSRSKEVTKGDATPETLTRRNLRPGTWEVKVFAGTWNAVCNVQIEKDKSKTLKFHYGSNTCN
ncbi:MAG: hypothetical protein KDC44_09315 [Phaeodactylibacter sp.]|nr:hypothetical protein [Phaeodactylibacter sp.]